MVLGEKDESIELLTESLTHPVGDGYRPNEGDEEDDPSYNCRQIIGNERISCESQEERSCNRSAEPPLNKRRNRFGRSITIPDDWKDGQRHSDYAEKKRSMRMPESLAENLIPFVASYPTNDESDECDGRPQDEDRCGERQFEVMAEVYVGLNRRLDHESDQKNHKSQAKF